MPAVETLQEKTFGCSSSTKGPGRPSLAATPSIISPAQNGNTYCRFPDVSRSSVAAFPALPPAISP
jgi:hypothetical protein